MAGLVLISVMHFLIPPGGDADQPLTLTGPGTSQAMVVSEDQAKKSIQWLADLALNKAPRTFDGDKHWGEQKKLWAGVRMDLDGFKLKTHRRWREVNHGRWLKYEVTLPPAAASNAALAEIRNVQSVQDEKTGQPRWQIQSTVVAPMTFTARIQRWNLGVRLYSMTVTGRLQVRLNSTASVAFVADYTEVPPAFVIDPRIDQAHLVMEHFEVDRISHIGGDFAEEWGELLEDVIGERFLQKQNERLVAKLNKSIDKERDDLRLSMADWLASW
ncbi:MAG: hypothetical protein MI861_23770 [Pirellulales bacterium]|nr:hypothetical protein [Pirellulales bacterium]